MRRGLNVSTRSLASVLKYDTKIPESRGEGTPITKGYYASQEKLVETLKKNVLQGYKPKKEEKFRTIEMQIMDMADDLTATTLTRCKRFAHILGMVDLATTNTEIMVLARISPDVSRAIVLLPPFN